MSWRTPSASHVAPRQMVEPSESERRRREDDEQIARPGAANTIGCTAVPNVTRSPGSSILASFGGTERMSATSAGGVRRPRRSYRTAAFRPAAGCGSPDGSLEAASSWPNACPKVCANSHSRAATMRKERRRDTLDLPSGRVLFKSPRTSRLKKVANTSMAVKRRLVHAKVIPVSTKENFRRPVPKTYSYRYEVSADAGPAGDPLVRKGAAIIEGRYRGRDRFVERRPVDDRSRHLSREGRLRAPARGQSDGLSAAERSRRRSEARAHAGLRRRGRAKSRASAPHASTRTCRRRNRARPERRRAVAPPGRRGPTPANEPAAYRKTG